jgi:methionine-S-sulfoxide reductase
MKLAFLIGVALVSILASSCLGRSELRTMKQEEMDPVGTQQIVVAGGCFWCLQPLFEMVKGVTHVEVGYAGGYRSGVSYEDVCSGTTGHAESVKVTFDPKVISADNLLRIFFTIHDPTTLNRQGVDHGTQYRSTVFYANEEERDRAKRIIDEISNAKIWSGKIVTTVEPLKNYTRAEEYHQDYYEKFEHASDAEKMQMNVGYCNAILAPKVLHFRQQFKKWLKS